MDDPVATRIAGVAHATRRFETFLESTSFERTSQPGINDVALGNVPLAPGQRIGDLALSPDMPDRDEFREAIRLMQIGPGYHFPNALPEHDTAFTRQAQNGSVSVAS